MRIILYRFESGKVGSQLEHFEKMGVLYLGRPVDIQDRRPLEGYLLYDSRDLVTHGMCVGMTGSGKTGLCIGLLEEAAMDRIPAIIIDPKGDMTNLLLTFPDLSPDDFRPWINEDDARRKSLTNDEYAAQQAELWKKGLASWGQDGERIRQLRSAAHFKIYTPGSSAGTQVSILKSFAAPPEVIRSDSEIFQEQVSSAATSLLALMGIAADPMQSREHILLATLFNHYWLQGTDVDLPLLIQSIQAPPVSQIGVMSIESFYPSQERFSLALKLNNLLASPSFSTWIEGVPLDIDQILYSPDGKPQHAIFSINHLSDAERMFFVTLLLNRVLNWVRMQSGTSSLRAILYMDEIFGFFPPVANPPSKLPLLTLLKQARAYGLGIMLTTQNPVDLDYKGLSNIGTWFIGRLQTERDKMKVMEGLESASEAQSKSFSRSDMDRILGSLGNRVFLMNNVHDSEPVLFETRWCMSYLRGPMTRDQIRKLSAAGDALHNPSILAPAPKEVLPASALERALPPVLPPGVHQYFVPVEDRRADNNLVYHPVLLGQGDIEFSDRKYKIHHERRVTAYIDFPAGHEPTDWDRRRGLSMTEDHFLSSPEANAVFEDLPEAAGAAKNYKSWADDLSDWLYRNSTLPLTYCPALDLLSEPEEDQRDFRIRLQQASREKRDEEIGKLRARYESRIRSLEERIRKAEQQVEREAGKAKQQQTQTAIALGSTLLSSLFGRKAVTSTSLSRMATTARSASRIGNAKDSLRRSQENVENLMAQLEELESEFRTESDQIADALDPQTVSCETYEVKPTRKGIHVRSTALVWLPYRKTDAGSMEAAWESRR